MINHKLTSSTNSLYMMVNTSVETIIKMRERVERQPNYETDC